MFLQNFYNVYKGTIDKNQANFPVIKYDGTPGNALNSPSYCFQFAAPYAANMSDTGLRGSMRFISNGTRIYYDSSYNTNPVEFGIILGDGDTPPTLSDHALSGNKITDFTATSSVSSAAENGKLTVTAIFNITNTGASDFTIREIGLLVLNSFSSPTFNYLILRDVLSSPVTIAAGNAGTLIHKLIITQ